MITEYIDYQEGDLTCEGFIAYNEDEKKKPCILVCHAWGGQSEHERNLAIKMAELGYIGFAVDIYGKGKRGDPFQGNEHLMQPFMEDREMLKRRLLAAVETVKNHPVVDEKRIGAIGLCFGGLCVLDLARSATENVLGVVSFHGGFASPNLPQENIRAKVLILHGYEDPNATPDKILEIANELTNAKADWQIHTYGNTMHAFTAVGANLPEIGIMYNETSAKRAWLSMKNFLNEVMNSD